MAALFLAGDMRWRGVGGGTGDKGGGDWNGSPETLHSDFSKLTTNGMSDKFPRTDTALSGAEEKQTRSATFSFKSHVTTPDAVC